MKVSKPLMDPNLGVFVQSVVDHVKDGWEIDPMNPPNVYGYWYECHVLKEESEVEAPKKSRAEILAAAREAKKAKAQEDTSADAQNEAQE